MSRRIKFLNLALQGGGAQGAFTWGALDRLLGAEDLEFEGISGTSSGALNAAVFAQGLLDGGREGARRALARFWERVGGTFAILFAFPTFNPVWPLESSGMPLPVNNVLKLAREFSPYELNPLGHNPLRGILDELLDFEALRARSPVRLFVSATQIRTGKVRVFGTHELSMDALLASACLPSLAHAVHIDGEPYWDGGFTGNPPVFPLIFECRTPDVLVIIVQPLERDSTPTSVEEIRARMLELTFSSAFLREMRAIAISKQHIRRNWLPGGSLERLIDRLNVHILHEPEAVWRLVDGNRARNLPAHIRRLHDLGHAAADRWLTHNLDQVGTGSTIDLAAEFC
jgi:NTE family protein